jgi:choline dehydrogenase-like flavoprotein
MGFFPGYSKTFSSTVDKFRWNVLKVHPRNERVGTVSLRSGDPRHTPDINFRFFDERRGADHDLSSMAEGVGLAREMFSKVSKVVGEQVEEHPDPHVQGDAVKQAIRIEPSHTALLAHVQLVAIMTRSHAWIRSSVYGVWVDYALSMLQSFPQSPEHTLNYQSL